MANNEIKVGSVVVRMGGFYNLPKFSKVVFITPQTFTTDDGIKVWKRTGKVVGASNGLYSDWQYEWSETSLDSAREILKRKKMVEDINNITMKMDFSFNKLSTEDLAKIWEILTK